MSSSPRYSLSIRILHWFMAATIIALFIVGLVMSGMPRTDPLRATLFSLHKSFGVTILMLVVVRFCLRLRLGAPPLPEAIPLRERRMALLGHTMLYVLMVLLPLSGFMMTNAYGFSVYWFGLELPRIISADKALGHVLSDRHALLAYTLIGTASVHALAVLYHFLKERINLLPRML